jgi:polysaccharide biosynthesis protein PslH
MKILFLTQVVPYPPDAGPKVKTWNVLRYLVDQGHQITLVSFVRKDEERYLDEIRKTGIEVVAVPLRRSRLADFGFLVRSYLLNRSFLIERDNLHAMHTTIAQLMSKCTFDVIHADQFTMPQFVPLKLAGQEHIIKVFDAHNANWSVMGRLKNKAPFYMKPVLAQEQRQIKKYEGKIVSAFEYTLAVTDIDRELLLDAAQTIKGSPVAAERIITIPIAVDTMQLQAVARQSDTLNIVTIGTLHYQPNADGIRWFINEVFPLIRKELPDVSLTIIGKNPPADIARLATTDQKVNVTGYVEDLVPYLEKASLMVVPVRTGGGMRVRILEAFSRGIPVVTTTTGLEGIDARAGEDVLVADQPDLFAKEVIRLAKDPSLQAALCANGRRLAESKYDWLKVLGHLDAIYGKAKSQV